MKSVFQGKLYAADGISFRIPPNQPISSIPRAFIPSGLVWLAWEMHKRRGLKRESGLPSRWRELLKRIGWGAA